MSQKLGIDSTGTFFLLSLFTLAVSRASPRTGSDSIRCEQHPNRSIAYLLALENAPEQAWE